MNLCSTVFENGGSAVSVRVDNRMKQTVDGAMSLEC